MKSKSKLYLIPIALLSLSIILVSCFTESEEGPSDLEIANEIWGKMSAENYNDQTGAWKFWPGKTGIYSPDTTLHSSAPHGPPKFFQTFVNSVGYESVQSKSFPLPDGTIIAKQHYDSTKTLNEVTVMTKRKGYDAANNDWFWTEFSSDGTVKAQGKVLGCIACHSAKKSDDYIWTRIP
jgi:hypothetical protein